MSARIPDDEEAELVEMIDRIGDDKSTGIRRALNEGLGTLRERIAIQRYLAGEISVDQAARLPGARIAEARDRARTQSRHSIQRTSIQMLMLLGMMQIVRDATTVTSLGPIGELDLIPNFSGILVVLPAVQSEIDSVPAGPTLRSFLESHDIQNDGQGHEEQILRGMSLLEGSERNRDVGIIGAILALREDDRFAGGFG